MSESPIVIKESSDDEFAPPTANELIPQTSKRRYETVYANFMQWRLEKNVEGFSETIFLNYFQELAKTLKPTSLWSTYSMIRSMLDIKHRLNIYNYSNLRNFLRQIKKGYKSKKVQALNAEQINRFLEEAPDSTFLAVKVALIFGMQGACSRHELCYLTVNDIEDDNQRLLVNIPKSNNDKPKKFQVTDRFYQIYKKYAILRPSDVSTTRFFLNYRDGKCLPQVIGINSFGSMPKTVATYLKLKNPESYTGHTFRRIATEKEVSKLISLTSRRKYQSAYVNFMRWRSEKQIRNLSESVFLAYFKELAKINKSTTLWWNYSMLRSMIDIKHKLNISSYPHLMTFLRQKRRGHKKKKAPVLNAEHVNRFLQEAPDNEYLAIKVALILGKQGACKRQELCDLRVCDIEDKDEMLQVNIPSSRNDKLKTFYLTGHYYQIYRKYADLRPNNVLTLKFFLNYRDGKCSEQAMDLNCFSIIPKTVASFLNLKEPESYAGYTVKRKVVSNLLPQTTRQNYEVSTYEKFMRWRSEKEIESFSEPIFLTYFKELSKTLKPSKLWSAYSMLRSMIDIKHKINIFNYSNLMEFLKPKNQVYKGKKVQAFSAEQINRFLQIAPDKKFLLVKVALIFGVQGACSRQELCDLTVTDIEDKDGMLRVQISKNKNNKPRSFVLANNFYKICKKYSDLRPNNVSTSKFFLIYRNGKCSQQVVGVNSFGIMPKTVAVFLKLKEPESYNGHTFRRTAALLADCGVDLSKQWRNDNCKSKTNIEGCVKEDKVAELEILRDTWALRYKKLPKNQRTFVKKAIDDLFYETELVSLFKSQDEADDNASVVGAKNMSTDELFPDSKPNSIFFDSGKNFGISPSDFEHHPSHLDPLTDPLSMDC